MTKNEIHNERIAKTTFAAIYPLYVQKIVKKGKTEEELLQIIEWLTGFKHKEILQLINDKASMESFFTKATLNPNASKIKGLICGYRIEAIENALTQKVRYLDKLVDELSKGKKMEKILRS